MKKNFVEELRWRGMLHDIMPGTEELLNKEMVKAYIGFDPTADSLGVGNLVQIMTLLHFQQCGHKPIALIGGATGMVGDPSGKSEERNLLNEETLQYNLSCQKKQLEKFLDFETENNPAEIVNNFDWFKDFNFLAFIRDVGKYITVNYMMAKESVRKRIEGEVGMSFTEFTYQLIQGYDFFYLWKNHDIKLQMGGSDQWGNIVTGTELIRRKEGGTAYAITTPLIKKADGSKFGKSESGNIWLDPKKTSPYQFYQFWLNAADEDVKTYIRIFSLKSRIEIEELETKHFEAPHLRLLQKELGKEITCRVHSQSEFESVLKVTELLFNPKLDTEYLGSLSESDWQLISDEIPTFHFANPSDFDKTDILTLLSDASGILPSKSEARRSVTGNAISVNKEKIQSIEKVFSKSDLLAGSYLFIENGKKNKCLLKVQ